MQTDPTASSPRFLGKYQVLARLDAGGMAEIFLARAGSLAGFEKLVVLKRILPHLAAEEEFVSLFLDEAKTTVALSHGSLVQVFDMGKDAGGDYFIAMEYVAGKNLRRVATRVRERTGRPFEPPMAAWIVARILEGLDYAHRRTDGAGRPLGIVHRDVSPHNILISYEGEVKLTDFGIAKAAGKVSHTEAGFVRGKANYMSPEQAAGGPIDARSDLFSSGVVLWELLTGEPLFAGDNPDRVVALLKSGPPPPPPSSRRGGIPPALDAILARALARDPADRYTGADLFLKDLGKFLASEGAVLGPRDLAAIVQEAFAEEIEREQKQIAALPREPAPPGEARSTPAFATSGELRTGASIAAPGARSSWRRRAARASPLLAGLGVIAGLAWIARDDAGRGGAAAAPPPPATRAVAASSPTLPAPTPQPPAPTSPFPRSSPAAAGTKSARASPVPSSTAAAAAAMATLSINASPWGAITIDGEPIALEGTVTTRRIAGQDRTTTPLRNYPLKAGTHLVRVEQIDDDGKVVRRGELEIDLAPGENRTLRVPMQPVD